MQADLRMVLYPAYHAFTRPDKVTDEDKKMGLFYDEEAATQSWQLMCDLLDEIF